VFCGGTNVFVKLLAIRAGAKNLKNVGPYAKSILRLDGIFKIMHQALIQMHAATALIADQMMMMLAWLNDFVPALTIAEINGLD
jgi:hypothetical protein